MGKKFLYLMCGPAGAGKTTFIQRRADRGTSAWISRDKIRFDMVPEDAYYFSREDEVFQKWCEEIVRAIDCPWVREIWADATHLNPKSRTKTLDKVKHILETTTYWKLEDLDIIIVAINPPLNEVLDQNELRRGKGRTYVPRSVVKRMHSTYEAPTFNEKYKYYEIQELIGGKVHHYFN